MTPDQINAAIAESLGWKLLLNNRWTNPVGNYADTPDYYGSLDAIVPVVREMDEDGQNHVFDILIDMEPSMAYALATPAQWCEAYLKAKGLQLKRKLSQIRRAHHELQCRYTELLGVNREKQCTEGQTK